MLRTSSRVQSPKKVATVAEEAAPAPAQLGAAEEGKAAPDSPTATKLGDEAPKAAGPSAALDIPFTPMTLVFKCAGLGCSSVHGDAALSAGSPSALSC